MMRSETLRTDYLKLLLDAYFPLHFFALFRAHELYNVEPYIGLLNPPILDLCCGNGLISQMLFGHVLDFGIDRSENVVLAAKKRSTYKTVFHGDVHQIPLDSGSLGGIFSNCALEHIADLPSLVTEISRILKPGAFFIATALSPFYYTLNPVFKLFDRQPLRWLQRKMIAAENELQNHVSIVGVGEYRQLFESNGMSMDLHKYYATESVANFCNKWDTASKYVVPYPVGLRHKGVLVKFLSIRYGHRINSKEETVRRWYKQFYNLCYSRNDLNKVGVGQILVARKLSEPGQARVRQG